MKKSIAIITIALSATLTGCVVPVEDTAYVPVDAHHHRVKHKIRHEHKMNRAARKAVRKAAKQRHLAKYY